MQYLKIFVFAAGVAVLGGCATEKTQLGQTWAIQQPVYQIKQWSLNGRIAISTPQDAWSANIDWQHHENREHIKLSGPLGQGAATITLTPGQVIIDRGGQQQTSNQPEMFINQQLGLHVPMQALRYWVAGVPEPEGDFFKTQTGFQQDQWLVEYKQLQPVSQYQLPRKLEVMKGPVKLKMIVEEWQIND